MIINKNDSLRYETGTQFEFEDGRRNPTDVSLDFYFPTKHLFGLPEREDTLLLKQTWPGGQPYQLFATDVFGHDTNT